ncbi:phenylacetate--CoA ligase family protein [Desulfurobacterium atlanticum]|uniref:Phenylacetate-coenzyme A ligase n=1 Tax=Desulfurobacterium atlanticum TaxID=240169 RepID=A0A238ZNU6_9BACT|nr:phenylacetate--CoA ligase [Desulfurobacterium atlanticum]SNR84638.1 phenylacetate-CoA ligase [Desulfurobacterium atlanticum]
MFQRLIETMPRERIERLQLERLKRTISRIKEKNSFYWEKIGKVEVEDIKSLDDIKQLPFLTKEDLRKGYPFGFACGHQSEFVRFHMSSGTTGTPVVNPYTPKDIDQWGEIMARCLAAAGITFKDVLQITPSFGLFNGGFGFHYGAEKIGCFVVPIGPGRTFLQLKFFKDFNTTALAGIASYPLRIIEVAKEEGFDFSETSLRVGIFGAEVWSEEMRRYIEKEMGIEAFDIIGMTETGGVGLGIECSFHSGIHVWEDHYFIEIINPETGEVLPDGEEGEMVVTTLTREGLPLIRYRTRDITKIVSRERCECGRTHIKVARIKGRTDDMLKVKGVCFYPKQIEEIVMKYPEILPDYQIVIGKSEGKDFVKVVVETERIDQYLKNRLEEEIYSTLGLHVDIVLVKKGEIERKPGKVVRVRKEGDL